MATKLKLVELLAVDPVALPKFLYSCAATEVLAKDIKIITEPTGLLWFGIGKYFPGGTAKRVGETLSPNERKIAALAGYNQLLIEYHKLLDKPKEQLEFLLRLERARDQQVIEIRSKFAEVEGHNESADNALYYAAKSANSLQSVACISLAVLATGGSVAAVAGLPSLAGLGLSTATTGKLFAITLGTKAIIATAQSEHDWKSLKGFLLFTVKDGAVTLGELSNKVFELAKDASINHSRSRMGQAIAENAAEIMKGKERIWALQRRIAETTFAQFKVNPGSDLYKAMEAEKVALRAEIKMIEAGFKHAGEAAVGYSKTSMFMKNFGGKAVPVVCLAIDVLSEHSRYQEVDAEIEKGGYRPQPGRVR